MPVVYTCVIILPLSYIVGLVYSLKTHKAHIYDKFVSDVDQSESIIAYIIISSSSPSSYSNFYVGSMYDDICLHVARSYTSSANIHYNIPI